MDDAPPTHCRLLIDPPADGAWNMAVDEALWRWSAHTAGCCWRFYQWSEPTLSLGHFQSYEERWRHAPSRECPVVRRPSGGGAIVHDQELTYSLVVPAVHRLAARRLSLYVAVHTALIDALVELEIAASLCGQSEETARAARPFLCFQRRAPGDVLVGDAKIAGSAQRRSREAVLQHGSVLLARSPAAPELQGIQSFASAPCEHRQLISRWLERLVQRLEVTFHPGTLSDAERRHAEGLVETKYGSPLWNRNRGRKGRSGNGPVGRHRESGEAGESG